MWNYRFFNLIFVFWFVCFNAQAIKHDLIINQKNDKKGLKEEKITSNGEIVGIRQFQKNGDVSFSMVSKLNRPTEYQATYYFKDGNASVIINASSRAGFSVTRTEKNAYTEKNYHNSNISNINDLDRNVFFNQVKKIKDSADLLNNRNVIKLLNEKPKLIRMVYYSENGKKMRSQQLHEGKVIGTETYNADSDKDVVGLKNNEVDGGFETEYQNGLITRRKIGSSEDFYGYNQDKKLVQRSTYENGKLVFETNNFFNEGKLIRREFSNKKTKESTVFEFTYDDKGMLKNIQKNDGKNKTVYSFQYTYW